MYAPGIPFFQTTLRVKAVPPAEDGLFPAIAGETGRLRFFPFPPIRDYGAINILNTYPDRMINAVTVPKKIQISFQVITFFRRAASGTESPTVAIMNAIAVPIGTPFQPQTPGAPDYRRRIRIHRNRSKLPQPAPPTNAPGSWTLQKIPPALAVHRRSHSDADHHIQRHSLYDFPRIMHDDGPISSGTASPSAPTRRFPPRTGQAAPVSRGTDSVPA